MTSSTIALEVPKAVLRTAARPGVGRLTRVELRKMVDTRAGFWLLIGVLALMITTSIVAAVTGDTADHTLHGIFTAAVWPAYVLLPVVGILLVSSEWSQRTTLITFTLVPHRSRVLVSKLLAGVLVAAAAWLAALAIAALVTAVAAPGIGGTWSPSGIVLGQTLLLVVAAMITGLGFGAMLLSSAPAIVLSFGLPLAWSALGSIPSLTGTAGWLDGSRSYAPLTDHVVDATEWARVGTTVALWMLVPVLVGVWRISRSEVA
jgi:ABC-type transport system involved in multi-copper enzyme maturation permease subunit